MQMGGRGRARAGYPEIRRLSAARPTAAAAMSVLLRALGRTIEDKMDEGRIVKERIDKDKAAKDKIVKDSGDLRKTNMMQRVMMTSGGCVDVCVCVCVCGSTSHSHLQNL